MSLSHHGIAGQNNIGQRIDISHASGGREVANKNFLNEIF
jgi:hypothetical protein